MTNTQNNYNKIFGDNIFNNVPLEIQYSNIKVAPPLSPKKLNI